MRELELEAMTVEDVAKYAAHALWERQARDIQMLYVEDLVGYADFFIIVSARNERHVQALSNYLERKMRGIGFKSRNREGVRNQRWGLSDYGDFVVHIFEVEERTHYDLEGLWHEAPRVEFDPENFEVTIKGIKR